MKMVAMLNFFAPSARVVRITSSLAALVALASAAPAAWSQATASAPLRVTTAAFKDIATYSKLQVPAQVIARNRVQLSAQIAGVVQQWQADTGSKVRRGQTLAQLDPRDMSLALAQTQAAKQAAEARLALAKQQLKRGEELVTNGFFSSEALNQRETEVTLLQADLNARIAAVATAKHALSKTKITAPFNAVVLQRMAQVGNTVSPGTPLFELSDTAAPEVETELSKSQANSLRRATTVAWQSPSQSQTFTVRLLRVTAALDSRTRNQTVRLKFDRYTNDMPLPGANGSLQWQDTQPHLSPSLLVRRGQHMGYFTVQAGLATFNPLPNAQESRPAPVNLSPETVIVTQGQAALQDGQAVTTP